MVFPSVLVIPHSRPHPGTLTLSPLETYPSEYYRERLTGLYEHFLDDPAPSTLPKESDKSQTYVLPKECVYVCEKEREREFKGN